MKFNLLLSALVLASTSAFSAVPNRIARATDGDGVFFTAAPVATGKATVVTETPGVAKTAGGGETYTFAYGGDPNNASYMHPDYKVFAAAMGLDPNTTMRFNGAKVVKILIGSGRNSPNYPIEYFLTNSLDEFGELTEAVLSAPDDQWNEFELETPVEIKGGEPLFVGYVGVNDTTLYKFPMSFNDTPLANEYAFLYALPYGAEWQWGSYAYYAGSVAIRLVLESDKFPHNQVTVSLAAPDYVDPKDGGKATLTLTNDCVDNVTGVTVEYSIGSGATRKTDFECSLPLIDNQQEVTLSLDGLSEGVNQEIKVNVAAVNGNPVEAYDGSSTNGFVSIFDRDKGVARMVVAEESFSTGDGFGPQAIESMKAMLAGNPEGSVVGICTHKDDDMAVSDYVGSDAVGTARFNRLGSIGVVYPDGNGYQNAFAAARAIPAFATVGLTVTPGSNAKEFNFSAETEFKLDVNGSDFALAFVAIENNVGPYDQFNYFSNGIWGELDGWTEKGIYAETIYNNVARGIYTYTGLPNSIPATVEPGKPVKFDYKASFESIANPDNCRFVALLLNKKTGVIENAAEAVKTDDGAAISTVETEADAMTVHAVAGGIEAEGIGVAEVYTIDGCHVATLAGGSSVGVAAGIYVVATPAGSVKLIVK